MQPPRPQKTFRNRLPVGAALTSEDCGYTMWHLLAAQLLAPSTARAFLEVASEESTNVLIDDLQEHMAVFPADYRLVLRATPSHRLTPAWPWEEFRAVTAWRSPIEICRLIGRPLVTIQVDWQKVHPVIRAAQASSFTWL